MPLLVYLPTENSSGQVPASTMADASDLRSLEASGLVFTEHRPGGLVRYLVVS